MRTCPVCLHLPESGYLLLPASSSWGKHFSVTCGRSIWRGDTSFSNSFRNFVAAIITALDFSQYFPRSKDWAACRYNSIIQANVSSEYFFIPRWRFSALLRKHRPSSIWFPYERCMEDISINLVECLSVWYVACKHVWCIQCNTIIPTKILYSKDVTSCSYSGVFGNKIKNFSHSLKDTPPRRAECYQRAEHHTMLFEKLFQCNSSLCSFHTSNQFCFSSKQFQKETFPNYT